MNEVARRACGKPNSTQDGGKNGLSTVGLFSALQGHTALGSASDAMAVAGNVRDTPVFSNSSSHAQFMQNLAAFKAKKRTLSA